MDLEEKKRKGYEAVLKSQMIIRNDLDAGEKFCESELSRLQFNDISIIVAKVFLRTVKKLEDEYKHAWDMIEKTSGIVSNGFFEIELFTDKTGDIINTEVRDKLVELVELLKNLRLVS